MLNERHVLQLTPQDIAALPDEEKLRIICDFSAKSSGGKADPQQDHRRSICGQQLARLVILIQGQIKRREQVADLTSNHA